MDSRCDKEPYPTDCIKGTDHTASESYRGWDHSCTTSKGSSFWPQSSSTVSTSKKEAKDSESFKGQHCSFDKLDTEDQRSTSKCAKPGSLSCSQSSSIVSSSYKSATHFESFKGQLCSVDKLDTEDQRSTSKCAKPGSLSCSPSSSIVSSSYKSATHSESFKGQLCSVDKLDTEDQRSTSKCAKPGSLSCSQSSSIVSSSYKSATHSESFKGQQYSFTEPVPEDLLCSICHELLDEPQQTSCGHLFCKKCLDQSKSTVSKYAVPTTSQSYYTRRVPTVASQKETFKCPACRTTCYNDGFDDKHTDRRVKNLQITCSNTSCTWKGSLCTLDDHKAGRGCEGCQYEPVSCTLGCGEKVVRKDLEHHKRTKCSYRPADCKYCRWHGTCQTLNSHYSTCQKYPLTCPNKCGSVTGYIQKCPEQKVKCPYSNLGCNIITKRKFLDSHTDSCKDYHLQLTMNRVCQLTHIVMEQALDTTNQLSFTYRPWLENTKLFPSMPWIIRFDEFSKKKTQHSVCWTSDPFFTTRTGYKLCLSVYAGGDKQDSKDHISVFTELKRGPNNDILSWPFDKTVKVTLLNQLEDRYHHSNPTRFKNADCECCKIKPGAESATGWGKSKFIHREDLDKKQFQNCQYLKDDCLFFMVEVE